MGNSDCCFNEIGPQKIVGNLTPKNHLNFGTIDDDWGMYSILKSRTSFSSCDIEGDVVNLTLSYKVLFLLPVLCLLIVHDPTAVSSANL